MHVKIMNIIDIAKDSWLFDEHFKGITGPLIVAVSFWSVRSIRRLFFHSSGSSKIIFRLVF